MTSEQQIEEILNEAASVGLRSRTIESAYNILKRNPDIDRVSAYNSAFNALLETTEEPDVRDLDSNIQYVDNEDDDISFEDEKVIERFSHLDDDDDDLDL